MSIGERLKLIRKESGLNQTEFGARINLSQTTIGLYESNNRAITDRALSQICSAFNINETWLKTGEGEMRRATSPLFLRDSSLDATDREIIESSPLRGETGIHSMMRLPTWWIFAWI